jgi:hypothetical protein
MIMHPRLLAEMHVGAGTPARIKNNPAVKSCEQSTIP